MQIGQILIITLLGLNVFSIKSCVKSPEYKQMKDWKVVNYSPMNFEMEGKALYYNPNGVGCNVIGVNMDVYIDGTKVTTIVQDGQKTKVPPKSTFEIPLKFNIKPEGGIMNGLKNSFKLLSNQKVKVRYVGVVTLEILKIPYKVPMDATEEHSMSEFMK